MHMSIIIIAGSMLQVTVIRKRQKQINQRKWTQKRRKVICFSFSLVQCIPLYFSCAGLQVSKETSKVEKISWVIGGSGIVAKIKRKMRMEKKIKKEKTLFKVLLVRWSFPEGPNENGSIGNRWARATTRILGADRSGGRIGLGVWKVNSVQIQVGDVVIVVDARA